MFTSSNPTSIGIPVAMVPYGTGRGLGIQGGTPTASASTANMAYFLPFVGPRNGGISSITINCATAAGNYDIGVYSYSGSLISSSGATAAVLGNNTWTPASPVPISGGVEYWIAFSASSASASWCKFTGNTTRNVQLSLAQQASAHPLPATFTLATASASTFVPIFWMTLV